MPSPDLGSFSLSLTVGDLGASRAFYERLGFEVVGGDADQGWLILSSGEANIGLFHGMFEKNLITFTPSDVRAIQRHLEAQGVSVQLQHGAGEDGDPAAGGASTEDSGPAHFMLTDPDGNQLLFDQF